MAYDIRFKTPFNCIVSGMNSSGKTTWCKNLLSLKDKIFTEEPAKIFLFYRVMQDIYLEMEREGLVHELINIREYFPSLDEIHEMVHPFKDKGGSLLLFDDSMVDITPDFEQLFCNVSHHENCSLLFLTQNLFYNNKSFRTMSLNAHYLVLMKNDRDKQQISTLAKQFSPNNSAFIVQAYENATLRPFNYLILDFRPESHNNIRVRTNIFPDQFPTVIYQAK